MKIYTRTGDEGETGLFGGQRVSKDVLRVETYGTVDELNSHIGLALAAVDQPKHNLMHDMLTEIQSRLFDIGADLSTPEQGGRSEAALQIVRVGDAHIQEMEQHLDDVWAQLPEMKSFVLPGGTELAARLHVARTICRRAERLCVRLQKQEQIGDAIIAYLNRLSDLLFALARYANHQAGVQDIPWVSPRKKHNASQ